MNILLVDDDQPAFRALRGVIENHFRTKGIRLYYAATIPKGLEIAKSDQTIKLVLLDLGMPCVDGPKDALGFIKKFPCSVAVYSAHADPDMISAATDAGAVSFISKFDRPEEQLGCIDEIVQSVRAAHVRIKTEESEGYEMARVKSRFGVPAMVGAAGFVFAVLTFFVGEIKGSWSTAREIGRKEQAVADQFESNNKRLLLVERDLMEASRWRGRMEKNIVIIMDRAKITPARDGE